MAKFGSASQAKLNTCDDRLIKIMEEVVKHWDCTILEGFRNEETQNELFRAGKSKVQFPNGQHNQMPSKAVDAVPFPIDWNDLDRMRVFGGFVMGVAASLGITLRWGGDWNGNRIFNDQSFIDLPHFEIVED